MSSPHSLQRRQKYTEDFITLVQDAESFEGRVWDEWFQKNGLEREPMTDEIIESFRKTGRAPMSVYNPVRTPRETTGSSNGTLIAPNTDDPKAEDLATQEGENVVAESDEIGPTKQSAKEWAKVMDIASKHQADTAVETKVNELRKSRSISFNAYMKAVKKDTALSDTQKDELKLDCRATAEGGQFAQEKRTLFLTMWDCDLKHHSALEAWKDSIGIRNRPDIQLRPHGTLSIGVEPTGEVICEILPTHIESFNTLESELKSMEDECAKLMECDDDSCDRPKIEELATKIRQMRKERDDVADITLFALQMSKVYGLCDFSDHDFYSSVD